MYTLRIRDKMQLSYTELIADGSSHYKTLQDNRMEERKI